MRKAFLFSLLLLPAMAMAQSLAQRGASIEAIVPEGREDGYVYNLNRPHLAI